MTDDKNHDGPHVWRDSDGLCAIQFCKQGARQEHAPVDPTPMYWGRDDRGAVGIVLALAALILVSAGIQVTTDIDPLTYFRAAVDWTATLLTEAWSQIR